MADSSDGVGSCPGFVDQLNKTFMPVRDVFGDTFPGGVLFVVAWPLGQVSSLLLPYQHNFSSFNTFRLAKFRIGVYSGAALSPTSESLTAGAKTRHVR